MSQHGIALKMQYQLAQLARKHDVVLPIVTSPEPLLPATDDEVTMSGIASDSSIDATRVMFGKKALLWHKHQLPPLYYRHQPTPIGKILELKYVGDDLRIVCETNHPLAKNCPAFSVAATITSFSMLHQDAENFHALVHSAWLDEVSLCPQGVNANALVHERSPARGPHAEFCDQLIKVGELYQKLGRLVFGGAR